MFPKSHNHLGIGIGFIAIVLQVTTKLYRMPLPKRKINII